MGVCFYCVQCVLLEHTLLLVVEIAQPAQQTVLVWWRDYVSVLVLQATTEQRLGKRTCHVHVSTTNINFVCLCSGYGTRSCRGMCDGGGCNVLRESKG